MTLKEWWEQNQDKEDRIKKIPFRHRGLIR